MNPGEATSGTRPGRKAILTWLTVLVLSAGCGSGGDSNDGRGTGGDVAGGGTSGIGGATTPGGGTTSIGGSSGGFVASGATSTTGGGPGSGGTPTGGGRSGGTGGASGGTTGGGGGAAGSGGTTGGGGSTAGSGGGTAGSGGGTTGGGGSGTPPVHQGYDGARGVSFNEGWRFTLGEVSSAEEPGFDDSSWTSLNVPHDWSLALGFDPNASGMSGFSPGGVGWYRKTFTLNPSDSGKRVLVEFDGVYMNSEVWINGTSLGSWPYGYTTFQNDLTPYVRFDGSNVIAVRVDNQQPNSRWYTGSGIYRNVWLTVLDPVHIAFNGAFVTTPTVSATSATVSVATEVENHATTSQLVSVTTEVYDPRDALVTSDTQPPQEVLANGTATVIQSLTVSSPELWSIEAPTLYQARITLRVGDRTVDQYTSPLGLRWFDFDPDTGFYLNGESKKIWGVCLHHDLGALGSAVNVRAIERQLQILKAMGTNGIRTSHNPPAPELLDLTDRMGFVVMDESFDVWETGKEPTYDYHVLFDDWAQADIQAQVRRDRNHPSVFMWSIGNEIRNPSVATATKLRDWVKALDTTRPVTWASNAMANSTVDQQVAGLLDLQGYNYFVNNPIEDTGNYHIDRDHRANPSWKVYGSEECSDVKSRGIYYTQDKDLHWTGCDGATKQCSSYDIGWGDGMTTSEMYLINTKRPYFFGQFDWTGFDYGGEATPYNGQWPAKSSYFGIVDTAGFPKDIYYFYQSRLTSASMVHILPHWNWSVGTTVWVWVYSNCDSVELFLNDQSLGSKSFDSPTTTRLEWDVPWASGTLRAEGRRAGIVVATEEMTTASEPAQVKLTADRTELQADGRDLAFVTADIQDQSGVFAPTATNSITFTVSGPGTIAGVDNGNPTDTTNYTSPTRNAFSGKALLIVQSTGAPGEITVTATSPGLSEGTASVTAM